MNRRGLSLGKRAAFLTAIFVGFLFLLEALMIVLEPVLSTGIYQFDPDLGFRIRAHKNGTNRHGFNDRDYPLERTRDTYRILFLGDSFSWAGGLEKNYTAILEDKFKNHYGDPRVEVVNAGYPMTHPGDHLNLLLKYGLLYRPDMVFLGFFAGNDFHDSDPNRKIIVVNDTYLVIDKRHAMTLFGYPIVMQSRLLNLIKQKLAILKHVNRGNAHAPAAEARRDDHEKTGADKPTFSKDKFLEIEMSRLQFCYLHAHHQGVFAENIPFVFRNILAMRSLLRERRISFAVGIYPDEFQVDKALLEEVYAYVALKKGLKKTEFDIEFAQRLLRAFLDDKQIPHVDLLDPFKKKGKTERLYIPQDTHWNEAGNELAAEHIFRFLLPVIGGELTRRRADGD